ncbi:MAG: hypothetical protein Q9157_007861 [Trypethelium eluteriae]
MDHSERETKGSEIDVPLMEKGPKMLENGVGGLTQLQRDLEAEGFEKFETILGGDGVGVLYPAVLHNGSEESQEGGEEIDQEKFLSVQGRDGVEKLVGVLGLGRGVREASPPKTNPAAPNKPPSTRPAPALDAAVAEDEEPLPLPLPLPVALPLPDPDPEAPVAPAPVDVALWIPPIDVAVTDERDDEIAEETEEAAEEAEDAAEEEEEPGAGVGVVPEAQEADWGSSTL